jgi:aspartate-semialdehyde dehydrogenase
MQKPVHLAVVGATGAVGQEFLSILEERDFPIGNLRLMASSRSAGKTMLYRGREYVVEDLETADPSGIDIALFSAGGSISKVFGPRFGAAGVVVVDNSSAFRMDPNVPLVIPEINPLAARTRPRNIIANPNCSTIIALVPLWPLHKRAGLKRAVIATYQAVSGAGAKAIDELESQTRDVLEGRPASPKVFTHPIAFNIFSHNSKVGPDGFNEEETKMKKETVKIFDDPTVKMTATCVRVPTFRSHAESINAEFRDPLSPDEAREILANAPGVKVVDEPETNRFPMPLETSGQDLVYVGRIRADETATNALALFVAGDQLRKGAATNAVQIAELVLAESEA